ncbi:MAG: GntR family transcriptional regulator [Candidatus Accumulibacter sp.]|jgi:DNA-binding GntR family transcriptional regulator|nr:GntR family transcriptional regulator [Accumulibacter sp.]
MNQVLNVSTEGEAPSEAMRIERASLHDMVVSRIRDMIIEGLLEVGARIHEGQLCRQLGVSRTPLREALKVLASEGLVELIPSRGAVVRRLTRKDARDMMEVLAHLERMAAPMTCLKASDAQIREIRRLHDEMLDLYAARDRLRYFKLNQRIHSLLVALSDNESLYLVHDILQTRMRRIRFIGDRTEETWAAAVADHEAMMRALEARDGEGLATAMAEHITSSWERIKNAIGPDDGAPQAS